MHKSINSDLVFLRGPNRNMMSQILKNWMFFSGYFQKFWEMFFPRTAVNRSTQKYPTVTNIYMLGNMDNKSRCEIGSKLNIVTPEAPFDIALIPINFEIFSTWLHCLYYFAAKIYLSNLEDDS